MDNQPFSLYNFLLDGILLLDATMTDARAIRDELFSAMWRSDNQEQALRCVAAKYELPLPLPYNVDIDSILARPGWSDDDAA